MRVTRSKMAAHHLEDLGSPLITGEDTAATGGGGGGVGGGDNGDGYGGGSPSSRGGGGGGGGDGPRGSPRKFRPVAESFGMYDAPRPASLSMPTVPGAAGGRAVAYTDDVGAYQGADGRPPGADGAQPPGALDPSRLMASSPRVDHWPGRNVFCCGGSVMLGSGGHYLPVTLTLTIVPTALFALYVLGDVGARTFGTSPSPAAADAAAAALRFSPSASFSASSSSSSSFSFSYSAASDAADAADSNGLRARLGPLAVYVLYGTTSALCMLSVATLLLAATTEPGIVPREPRWKDPVLPANPYELTPKYCGTCNVYRPPRAKHCSYCNNCVLVFDHHCPWTGNCVGLRNYHYFIWFVTSINLLTAFVSGLCIARFVCDYYGVAGRSFGKAIAACPVGVGVGLFAFLVLLTTFPLLTYHLCTLMPRGETTNENLRATWGGNQPNPYNRGCWTNLGDACVPASQPSMVVNWRTKLRAEYAFLNGALAEVRSRTAGTRGDEPVQ